MSAPTNRNGVPRTEGGAPLDIPHFPLHGSRLIEASAGTGKTFTIAMLYVRLVLGHGGENAHARPLTPPEILVVTFTEAATQELRERIRKNLAGAATLFRIDPDLPEFKDDARDPLHQIRNSYPPSQWAACARKLALAAEWMDEAAVSTIHGWCHRMLREHAFDSDSLFTQKLETDTTDLLAEVARDYWRSFMLALPEAAVEEVRRWWQDPAALLAEARRLAAHVADLPAVTAPALAISEAAAERTRVLSALKATWRDLVEDLQTLCDGAVAAKQVDGRKLQARYYQPWCQTLRDWVEDAGLVRPDLKTGWARLTPTGFAEIWKDGTPPDHPALQGIADLAVALDGLPDARQDVLRHAACWITERFDAEQARRAQMGFDDLLARLHDALHGANGERLADIIRRQFPVALIDEFQDTDPVQYRIFDAVYRVADPVPGTALVLIGDPKQAIYAFRGADIFTYLGARRAVDGRLYTLGRNFRSTPDMVGAANRLFDAAESRSTGRGAFLFRAGTGNPVPFLPAESANRLKHVLRIDGAAPDTALTVWWADAPADGKPLAKTAYLAQMAAASAAEIVRLLNLGRQGKATIAPMHDGMPDETKVKPLGPGHIAVLVNNRREADAVREALAARAVRSVYLSDKDSVLQSPQAVEIQLWLLACAEPDDPRRLRAALATATLDLGWDVLDGLNRDELAWEARVMQFRGYRECWRRQGVLPMLRRLLHDFDVPGRLLGEARPGINGERVLTDILHLAELLQQASALIDGEHALIRHLAEQRADAERGNGGSDARQIRLESDADIVQVVTVHKSKGLEYPLVFLPFAAACRPIDPGDDPPWVWHDDTGRARLALTASDEVIARADAERLGEDVRKLYVALTRAQFCTWMGVAPLADLHRSAVGYLLGIDAMPAPGTLGECLREAYADASGVAIAPLPPADTTRLLPAAAPEASGPARRPVRSVRETWWVASYSALASREEDGTQVAETATEDVLRELLASPDTDTLEDEDAQNAEKDAPARAAVSQGVLHTFPRGAHAGTFLHDLLEWAAAEGFERIAAHPERVRDTVARRCQLRGWEAFVEPLTTWLLGLMDTPLALPTHAGAAVAPVRLSALTETVAEMEFWLSATQVPAEAIDRLVTRHTLGGAARPALMPRQLNGMLKGFIDLVFAHEGRYYVADYKSNWLGEDDAAYAREAMARAVLEARYDLQYVLYTFALHRLLKSRLADYDYDEHVGGAVYVFLRGTLAPGQGLHVEKPPRVLIDALDALFAGRARG
ncbi:exodeoxyribonuclease V subunit beta [Achromobacter sp. GG226]|uniref:exodeoxyribonuclease V subunit beta n=1 Tax=Verticiella alkaliphila TaxID=2779529 RepID=UPI001C0DDE99|nr:exodeoxyribonuclease V subunit beta [Verticiella sp. GG226]MBU4610789.1 exodeoxyribonuclease V subunit beta [Verticiella sp. GG226]